MLGRVPKTSPSIPKAGCRFAGSAEVSDCGGTGLPLVALEPFTGVRVPGVAVDPGGLRGGNRLAPFGLTRALRLGFGLGIRLGHLRRNLTAASDASLRLSLLSREVLSLERFARIELLRHRSSSGNGKEGGGENLADLHDDLLSWWGWGQCIAPLFEDKESSRQLIVRESGIGEGSHGGALG